MDLESMKYYGRMWKDMEEVWVAYTPKCPGTLHEWLRAFEWRILLLVLQFLKTDDLNASNQNF